MNNEKTPKTEKEKLLKILCILGAVFLVLFFIINISTLSIWLSKIVAVLNPVIIGFIIAYLCNPICNWLHNKVFGKIRRAKLKKTLSIILTYIILVAVLAGLLTIILPQFFIALTDLISKIDGYINKAVNWANGIINNSNLFNGKFTDLFDFIDVNDLTSNLTSFIKNSGNILKDIGNILVSYGSNIVIGVTDALLGIFISVYVLIFKKNIIAWCKRITRALTTRDNYNVFMRRVSHANGKFGNYLIGAITDSIIVAVEGLIIFSIFGIPYAPLISVIIGITNVIPILGPFLGAIPSAFIIFIVDPSKVILFIILIIIIQQIDGNIVAPFILGSSLGLSSFGIIIAVTVMGGLWGIPGMFIGVPLFAFFADLIEESVNTKLRALNDPEFPPSEATEIEKPNKSPIISFIKKHVTKAYKTLKDSTSNKKVSKK
ncbi:MAG: AI-2E family transporter [Ruminococcaceae bacterium]|nr:AI-2E family transporter [Oscillospiraceae bacterium]